MTIRYRCNGFAQRRRDRKEAAPAAKPPLYRGGSSGRRTAMAQCACGACNFSALFASLRAKTAASALAALALAFGAPARAEDPRLVTRLYDPDAVVRIDGRAGVQATIAFGENEHIENVAVGDAETWQITPNKRADLLFVKPLAPAARTNMTVVTDRHTYFFDLVASARAQPLYMLRFTYRDDKKAAPAAPAPGSAMAALTAAERAAIAGEDDAGANTSGADPARLNFAWRQKGPAALLPQRIYDDGRATYVSWAAGAPVPAILIVNARGEEGPVNYAVRDDTIVVDGVPQLIVLRAGKERATLENLAPAAAPGRPALAATAHAPAQAKMQEGQ